MSLLFDHLDSCELAEHLTYLEYKSFCKILVSATAVSFKSCVNLLSFSALKKNPLIVVAKQSGVNFGLQDVYLQ